MLANRSLQTAGRASPENMFSMQIRFCHVLWRSFALILFAFFSRLSVSVLVPRDSSLVDVSTGGCRRVFRQEKKVFPPPPLQVKARKLLLWKNTVLLHSVITDRLCDSVSSWRRHLQYQQYIICYPTNFPQNLIQHFKNLCTDVFHKGHRNDHLKLKR